MAGTFRLAIDFLAELLTQVQIGAQLGVQAGRRHSAGKDCSPVDVGAGCCLVARQAVQQIAIVKRGGVGWKCRHHSITAADLLCQLVELHSLKAVVAAYLALG